MQYWDNAMAAGSYAKSGVAGLYSAHVERTSLGSESANSAGIWVAWDSCGAQQVGSTTTASAKTCVRSDAFSAKIGLHRLRAICEEWDEGATKLLRNAPADVQYPAVIGVAPGSLIPSRTMNQL